MIPGPTFPPMISVALYLQHHCNANRWIICFIPLTVVRISTETHIPSVMVLILHVIRHTGILSDVYSCICTVFYHSCSTHSS